MHEKIANKPQICLQDAAIHHYVMGENSWEMVAWRIRSVFLCVSWKWSMVSPYFVLILRHSPTSPLLPSLPAVLFPSHTGCGDLCFLASMCSFFCGNSSLIPFREALFLYLPPAWLGWGWPHLQPPGLALYLKPDWQKYRIPPTMGIGWRWAGASSWANQNQPVVL